MRVQLPDGKIAEFPDSMSQVEIQAVLQQQYNPEMSAPTSTVTGEKIPTPQDKFEASKGAIRFMAPMIGDVAATMMAPQLKGAGLGIKALNTLIRGGAAGAGGFGGDLAGQKLTNTPMDLRSATKHGIAGATGEVGGSMAIGAVKGLGNVAAPVLQMTPWGKRVSEKAHKVYKKEQKKFEQATTERALKFIDGMDRIDKADYGVRVGDAIAGKKDFKKVYEDYNELISRAAEENSGELLLEEMSQKLWDHANYLSTFERKARGSETAALNKVTDSRKIALINEDLGFSGKEARILRNFMIKGYASASDAKFLLAKIWKSHKSDPSDIVKVKESIKEAFLEDIGNLSRTGKKAKLAKEKGDEIFAATKRWFEQNPTAEFVTGNMRIGKGKYYESFPERSLDRIFNTSPDEALRIKNEVIKADGGDEAWAGAELTFIRDLYDKAIKKTPDTGKQRLLPDALADSIYQRQGFFEKVMPDIWPKLKAEAAFYKENASKFETLDVGDVWGSASAWEVVSPKTRKLVGTLLKGTDGTAKMGVKALSHGMATDD